MATKDGYYGSDDTSNTFMGNGTNWFTLVDEKLGDIDIYEDLLDDDKRAGTIFSESGKLEFNPNWFDQDFYEGKITLPIILLFQKTNLKEKESLKNI